MNFSFRKFVLFIYDYWFFTTLFIDRIWKRSFNTMKISFDNWFLRSRTFLRSKNTWIRCRDFPNTFRHSNVRENECRISKLSISRQHFICFIVFWLRSKKTSRRHKSKSQKKKKNESVNHSFPREIVNFNATCSTFLFFSGFFFFLFFPLPRILKLKINKLEKKTKERKLAVGKLCVITLLRAIFFSP